MELVNSSRSALLAYIVRQLTTFFPDERGVAPDIIDRNLDEALARIEHCINSVRVWRSGQFDYLHSSQYAIFLYYLSNTVWRNESDQHVCTKIFLLNKALNGIDCFYELELPPVFFIGHSVGIVLAKATYGNFLVLYQNSTVGKNHGVAPILGDGVVMYPNTAIIGSANIGSRSVIAQGVSVINRDTPGNCMVFSGADGGLVFKAPSRDVLADIFRSPSSA